MKITKRCRNISGNSKPIIFCFDFIALCNNTNDYKNRFHFHIFQTVEKLRMENGWISAGFQQNDQIWIEVEQIAILCRQFSGSYLHYPDASNHSAETVLNCEIVNIRNWQNWIFNWDTHTFFLPAYFLFVKRFLSRSLLWQGVWDICSSFFSFECKQPAKTRGRVEISKLIFHLSVLSLCNLFLKWATQSSY